MDFTDYEWLAAVRAHPRHTKYGWMAAHALFPWFDQYCVARVAMDTLRRDTCLGKDTLRAGFVELEALGLLMREPLRRNPVTYEYDVRVYRALLPHG